MDEKIEYYNEYRQLVFCYTMKSGHPSYQTPFVDFKWSHGDNDAIIEKLDKKGLLKSLKTHRKYNQISILFDKSPNYK